MPTCCKRIDTFWRRLRAILPGKHSNNTRHRSFAPSDRDGVSTESTDVDLSNPIPPPCDQPTDQSGQRISENATSFTDRWKCSTENHQCGSVLMDAYRPRCAVFRQTLESLTTTLRDSNDYAFWWQNLNDAEE